MKKKTIQVLRYPKRYKTRGEYCDKIGDFREEILEKIFTEKGYYVRRNPTHGIDLVLKEKDIFGKTLHLIECSNERKGSFYDRNVVLSKLHLFNIHKRVQKFWILSFKSSLVHKKGITEKILKKYGITVIELGFQTLPKKDYPFFEKRKVVNKFKMKPNTKETYKFTKTIIDKHIPDRTMRIKHSSLS